MTDERRTNGEIAERLEWWLAYFDDDAGSRHPDFTNNPEGFDESAIESDLYATATALREMEGTRSSCEAITRRMIDIRSRGPDDAPAILSLAKYDWLCEEIDKLAAILILTDPREKTLRWTTDA